LPENWYLISKYNVLAAKDAKSILYHHYNGNLSSALLHLFPEIGLEHTKLVKQTINWYSVDHRRQLLCNFAEECRFDPLVPANWYNTSKHTISTKEDTHSMLESHYNGDIASALLHLFPEMGIDKEEFNVTQKQYNLFIGFATKKGFDPLVANNWHQILQNTKTSQQLKASVSKNQSSRNILSLLSHVFPKLSW